MAFEERKGSIAQQLNGARGAHAFLVVKLMENPFKASAADYKKVLRLMGGKEERKEAIKDLEK